MYTQKGTQRIEVIVKGEGVFGDGEMSSSDARGRNNGSGERGKQQWAERRHDRILRQNAIHAVTTAIQIAKRGIHYTINGLSIQHGDKAMQEQVDRKMEIIEDAVSGIGGIVAGAMMGSFGGPIGVAVGIGIGLANAIANITFKYAEREREYNFKVFKQENAIEYKRARAGTNLTFGRLR